MMENQLTDVDPLQGFKALFGISKHCKSQGVQMKNHQNLVETMVEPKLLLHFEIFFVEDPNPLFFAHSADSLIFAGKTRI